MLPQRQHHPVQGPIADTSPPKHRWWQDVLIDTAHLHPSSDDRYQSQAENRIMLPWNILTTIWSILHKKNNKNKTWVQLGHWRITGGKRKILDMCLTLIETYWWGDGDDDDDDKKNEVRSQQVLNSWQFGIYSYSYTQPCVWDIFLWIVYLNSYPNNIFLWRTRSHKCCGCLFSPWWYQVYHSLHFPNGHGCISRPSLFVSIRYQLNLHIWCHNHVYQIWVYM